MSSEGHLAYYDKGVAMEKAERYTLPEGTKFLYHATYACLESSILQNGLLCGQDSCWNVDNEDYKKHIYLAFKPEVAYSYAECATDELDDNDDERIYSKIIIIAVPVDALDLDKLSVDENNLSNYHTGSVSTLQYEGNISKDKIIIIRTDVETYCCCR